MPLNIKIKRCIKNARVVNTLRVDKLFSSNIEDTEILFAAVTEQEDMRPKKTKTEAAQTENAVS